MLEDAAEAMRAGIEEEGLGPEREPVRVELDVDAYVPSDYVPFEAAKIDVHRRIAAARERGELRALADELADRFGPMPQPVANLLDMARARLELAPPGCGPWSSVRGACAPSWSWIPAGRRAQRARPRGDLPVAREDPGPAGSRRGGRPPRALLTLTEGVGAATALAPA